MVIRAARASTGRRRAGARVVPGLALALLAGAVSPAQATASGGRSAWTSGTFVYADVCTSAQSGTRIGQRVILRRSPNGDGLTYEGADLSGPVAAGEMTLDDATKTLTFAVETEAGPLRFQGVAAPDALTGTFEDEAGEHPVRLPRVLRSHAHETCSADSTGSLRRRR